MRRFLSAVVASVLLAQALSAAELRRAPYLLIPRPDGITIRWRTDDSVRHSSVLRYGTSPDQLDQAIEARELLRHYAGTRDWQATLKDLEPGKKYYYAVEADRATLCGADERHWFRTATNDGEPRKLRFWILGDSGSNRPRDDAKEKVLAAKAPMDSIGVRNGFRTWNKGQELDGILLLGDNAYPQGTDEQYQASFFNVYADELAHTPLWPCIGNHDIDDAYRHIFTANSSGAAGGIPSRDPHYYAANVGNVHLIVLDPWKTWWQETTDQDHKPWRRQVDWLKKDLEANKQQWTIVIQHFPPYCGGDYNSDTNEPLKMLREELVPLFDRYGVDLSLSGHDHSYQRSYLLKGFTDKSPDFDPAKHRLSDSDGRTAPIVKRPGPDGGVVYMVNGSAGGSRKADKLQHPVMVPFDERRGLAVPSSMVMEVDGPQLTGVQIDSRGGEIDRFSLLQRPAK